MFGLIGNVLDKAVSTVGKAVRDPIGTAVDMTLQPVRDGLEVIAGLTEGELRIKAAARLGADVAGDMALDQLIEWYKHL